MAKFRHLNHKRVVRIKRNPLVKSFYLQSKFYCENVIDITFFLYIITYCHPRGLLVLVIFAKIR